MKVIRYQLLLGAALLAGVAIGFFAGGPYETGAADEAEGVPVRRIADKGEKATVAALRRRIAALEKALAEKGAKSEIAISNAVAEAAQARPREPPRMNWRERMEEMKKNEPGRYSEMTNHFAQWRRSRAEQARDKIDFLSSIDTSRMSAGARKTHDALQELIARRENIEVLLQDEDLSDEERGKLMRELRESHHELQRLNGEERRNLIGETAKILGFTGDDERKFSATILDVIEATDEGFGRRHGGSRGGGPRGPGGPRGR